MTAADWFRLNVMFAVVFLAALKLRRQFEPGELCRSMSFASALASLGVCVYSTLAATALSSS